MGRLPIITLVLCALGANAQTVQERIARISSTCVELGIGFAGIDPFFLLDILSRSDRREDALDLLKRDYAFLWDPAPTDSHKATLGGYKVVARWKDVVHQRGNNYNLSICND